MTKTERVLSVLQGKKVDHIPFSFWTHMAGFDLDPVLLAEKTYEFYEKYDIDLIKTMNNGMYSVEDFGCILDQSQVASGGVTRIASSPVNSVKDWNKIKIQDVHNGALGRELYSLKILLEKVNGKVPVIFTVMSPMTTAEKLSNGNIINQILEGCDSSILSALEAITETTCNLAKEAIKLGASGIFFASQIEFYGGKDEKFCLKYEKPFDLQVLQAASNGWCNILHAHGENIMFDVLKDYPVHIFNWHVGESLPDIDEALDSITCVLMGGLNRNDIKNGNRNKLHNQIYRMMKSTRGQRMILSPGCVVRLPLNTVALKYVKDTLRDMEKQNNA